MPKVKSLTGHTETVRRWKIYTDGRAEDPQGHIHEELPMEIAFSPPCVDLARQGKLEVEGIKPDTGFEPKLVTPPAVLGEPATTSEALASVPDEERTRPEPHMPVKRRK